MLIYLEATKTLIGLLEFGRTLPFISSRARAADDVLLNFMYTIPIRKMCLVQSNK